LPEIDQNSCTEFDSAILYIDFGKNYQNLVFVEAKKDLID